MNFRYFPHIKIAFRFFTLKITIFVYQKNIAMNTIPYIIADNKIPYLKGILEPYVRIDYLSPERINAQTVQDADILLIRTRTKCNRELLDRSRCRYIATATIGYDHIDTLYCKEKGISWQNAPGCNASSVGQYVLSSLLAWSKSTRKNLQDCTIGISGSRSRGQNSRRQIIGMQVLLNDPPDKPKAKPILFLSKNLSEADIVTFHTPLTHEGKYPTYHLADTDFFNARPLIINTARGEIINTEALKRALKQKKNIVGYPDLTGKTSRT